MLKLIKNFTKKDWLIIIVSFALIFFQVFLELRMPDYMKEITRLVETEGSLMKDILYNGGLMLLCALGSLASAIIVGYLISYVASLFSARLRSKVFRKVESLSMGEIKLFSTNSLITRTTNDITQVEMLICIGLQLLIKAPITAVWAITKILNKNFIWSLATLVAVLILLILVIILVVVVMPRFKIVQKLIDKINGVMRENLSGIRVVRAFNAENYQENKFEDANISLTKQQLFNQRTFAIMSPIMYMVMNTLSLAIYFIGAYLIDGALMFDKISLFGDMIVFFSYAMQVIMSFLMLAMVFMILPRTEVSAGRINEILDTESSIKEGNKQIHTNIKGEVEFKHVSFKYPDAEEYILKDISFKAKKGETVAFIGSTGSGKSTLINLVPRFYDVSEGEILIDGVDVRDYKFKDLYNKLGYVPQKTVMFNGTVKSNVTYGESSNKKTLDTVKEAVKVAQASDFVKKLDKEYDSFIASGGTNVSGGQKQRLAIARAIARNPEIYIFDDSFSALDYKTDFNLRKALKKYTKDATNLIVAQRIGTVLHADKIIVLNEGECVGIGTHQELLKNCEVYKEIALSQVTKEELENA